MSEVLERGDSLTEVGIKLISSDNHINEPRDLFTSRLPVHLRDKAPRVVQGVDGGDNWSFQGEIPARTYGLEAMAGFDKKNYQISGLRYEDLRPGNYDPYEHLKDMDIDGMYASVCYPGAAIHLYVHPDKELSLAAFRAYNDWMLDDFEAADRKRLCGLALLPIEHGTEASVAELERVIKKGARAVYIAGTPSVPYNHPTHYEALWRAADKHGLTLCMHRNHGGPPDKTDWDFLDQDKVSIGGIVTRYFSCVRPLSYLIFTGIFERFPNIKFVGAEVDCGWVPFWVQTLDHHWEIQKSWFPVKLQQAPSEFIGKNIFTTNVDDYVGYQMVKTGLFPYLSNMTMFSSDYPHSATIWPDSRAVAEKMTAGMDLADKRKVLSENAARVFGFDI